MSTTEDRSLGLEPGAIGIDLVSAQDGTPILFLRGEIDASTVGRLTACFDALAVHRPKDVSIGFGEVEFMDSSGINAILDLRRRLDADARIHLRDCSPAIQRMCDVVGVSTCPEITVS